MPFSAKKAYAFDFDSNLVFTQDNIFLLKKNGGGRKKVEVSQNEFDNLKIDGIDWRWLDDDPKKSLENFIKEGNYKKSLLDALNNQMVGPAWPSFLEANETASPIAIITARGQSPQELKSAHEEVIYDIFNPGERERLVDSMRRMLKIQLQKDLVIDKYLNSNLYLPVESQEFLDISGTNLDIAIKIRKQFAFSIFTSHVKNLFISYYGKTFINNPEFSLGFSDDNILNSQSIIEFIKNELLSKYPKTSFFVYNTNDPNNVKKVFIKESR